MRTIAPGKARYIGSEYPGAERYAALLAARYSLATAHDPAGFLAAVQPHASLDAYRGWLAAYQRLDRSFLDHVAAWGGDRCLGTWQGEEVWLHGAMDDRWATNMHRLVSAGGLDPGQHVAGKRCLVVGAWDGTECLLLHALGAVRVDVVEEVPAFAKMASRQMAAWGVPSRRILGYSLYEVDVRELWQEYDLVYVPGVLYHLTDPVLALVICWATLAPGGVLAFESIVTPTQVPPGGTPSAAYLGALRGGWNWWAPTPECYEAMLHDAGFPGGRTAELSKGRGWWTGIRGDRLPALDTGAAGFSRPDVLRAIRNLT